MTLSKEPHYAEAHNVPDDYKFTADELQCIISGDMFTPRQGAIMARELLERRERDKQEPVGYACFSDVELMLTNRMVGGMLTVRKIGECPLYAAPPAPDDSAIFNAAIDRCRTDDVIDERAWNYGILRVITHYENCRSTMLNGGQS
ncbi:hypothetical protein [Pseudescherichia sp.]|uniref:hypothetical protein n=1 Tax=Pseudescherichia sp. TaxID=2055881 RepID=UPI0028AC8C13|nr:hypothetical protein [Pseudescherichia sp.]